MHRHRWVAAAATVLLVTGVGMMGAPPAAAADCPTVDPSTGLVTPRLAPGVDYNGCSFVGASLNNVDLKGANLRRTQWGDSSAVNLTLSGANLSEATFLGPVNLTGANLSGANLSKADLGSAFVNADSELGCGILGADPRRLPNRWTLSSDGCLQAKGINAAAAPRACPAYVSNTSTTPITISVGPHPLWVAGDISCTEATEILDDASENGRANSAELARLMARRLPQPPRDLPEGWWARIDIGLSDHESLSVQSRLAPVTARELQDLLAAILAESREDLVASLDGDGDDPAERKLILKSQTDVSYQYYDGDNYYQKARSIDLGPVGVCLPEFEQCGLLRD